MLEAKDIEMIGALLDSKLDAIKETLEQHTEAIAEIKETLAEVKETLEQHTEAIAEIKETQEEHTEALDELIKWADDAQVVVKIPFAQAK